MSVVQIHHRAYLLRMPRGNPLFLSGVIPSSSNAVADQLIQVIRDNIILYQTNGEPAWEVITSSSELPYTSSVANTRQTVLNSRGDRTTGSGTYRGDANIRIVFSQPAGISVANTGSFYFTAIQGPENYGRSSNPSGTSLSVISNQPTTWYAVIDEYEFTMIINQRDTGTNRNAGYKIISFGQMRRNVPNELSGIAWITTSSVSTGTVIFSVDRDIRGTGSTPQVQIGQSVWILNINTANTDSAHGETSYVQEITPTTITLSGVLNLYSSGSLIGLNPSPTYCFFQNGSDSSVTAHTLYLNSPEYRNSTTYRANLNVENYTALFAGGERPAFDQSFRAYYPRFRISSPSQINSYLGAPGNLLYFVSASVLQNGDRMMKNYQTGTQASSSAWMVFPNVVLNGLGLVCGIGPNCPTSSNTIP
ncbi:MAG: hypothetical protein HC875_15240 [Anaerolineales bacterium]|nr:hypothetical protein [Anaerolineales bacterium]